MTEKIEFDQKLPQDIKRTGFLSPEEWIALAARSRLERGLPAIQSATVDHGTFDSIAMRLQAPTDGKSLVIATPAGPIVVQRTESVTLGQLDAGSACEKREDSHAAVAGVENCADGHESKLGKIVELASGGPKMTITCICPNVMFRCSWFDANAVAHHADFPGVALRILH